PLVTGVQTCALPIFSYPNHFIQWIQVTVPAGLTGSGPGGAFTSADFIPASGWSVSSIAGNVSTGYVITFISASTDYTFNAGQSQIGRASCRERLDIW